MANGLCEDVFFRLFESGAVRSVKIEILADGRGRVGYMTQTGVVGVVHTKRGTVKRYKPETVLRSLRSNGVCSVKLEMRAWMPGAEQLAVMP